MAPRKFVLILARFNQTYKRRAELERRYLYVRRRRVSWEHGKDLIRSHCIYSLGCSGDLREAAGSPTETGLQNCLHYACSCHPLKKLTFLTPNGCVITFISALTPALMDFLSFQLWNHVERTTSAEHCWCHADQMSSVLGDNFTTERWSNLRGWKPNKRILCISGL